MPTFNFTTQTTLAIRDDIKGNIPPGTIHTIEQCFVDLNMELNENVNTSFPKKTASFRKGLYNLSEGSVDNIYVDLNSPSTLGIEELDLAYTGSNGPDAAISQDLAFSGTNLALPIRLSWGVGEKTKQIPFSALTDFKIENTEEFYFKLTNLINCTSSGIQNTTIRVQNVENFPFVYIQPYNATFASATADSNGDYNLVFTMPEGSQLKLGVFLSYPSIYGLEEVDVVFTNQSTKTVDYKIYNPYSPLAVNSESSYTKELNNSNGFIITRDSEYFSPYDYSTGTYAEFGPAFFPAQSIDDDYTSSVVQDSSNQIQSVNPTKFISQSSGEYAIFYRGSHNVNVQITFGDYIGSSITSIDGSCTMKLLIYKNGSIVKEEELYTKQITGLNTNINIPFSVSIPLDILTSDQLTFKLRCDVSEIIVASDYLIFAYAKLRIKTVDSNLDIIKTLGEVVHLKWATGELEKTIDVDIVNDDTGEPVEVFTIELQNAIYSNIVSDPTSVIFIPDTRFPKLTVQIQS
jgi:hypothetical protein